MTAREIKQRIPKKAAIATGLIGLMLAVGSAAAFHVGDVALELDENVADNGAVEGTDWAAIYNGGGAPVLPAGTLDWTGVIDDFAPGASGPDSSYHEPSNKDDQQIDETAGGSVWGCVSAANPGDKIDIVNAQALALRGAEGSEDEDDLLVFFEVERYDNSGDAFIGIWLFQADVVCNEETGKFEGEKRTGDVLLIADFTGGGTDVDLNAFSYVASGTTAPGTFLQIGAGGDCDGTADNNGDPAGGAIDMCLQVNDETFVDVPWPMEDKTKPGPPTPDVAQRLEIAEFVEGGINLTDAFAAAELTPPACFGAFLAETRSSSSLDATLKDFALGDLQTCDARVSISADDTNGIGESHTFTVTTEQQGEGGFTAAPVANVDVVLTDTNGSTAVLNAAASTCDDNQPSGDNVDANGQCIVVFSSATSGVVVGNAYAAINLAGTIINRDTDPTTSTTSGPGRSGPANKTYLDGTLVWHKVDQDGAALGGATFQVCRTHKLDSSTSPDSYVAEAGTDGVCSTVADDVDGTGGAAGSGLDEDGAPGEFLVSDLILGSYKVKETAAPAGYHIQNANFVSAGSHTLTDTSLEIVAPFVNERAFRVIVITCDDVDDTLVDGTVTFDVNGNQGGPTTMATISAAQLAALLWEQADGDPLTQQEFCNQGGASIGDLDPGTYDVNVEVPDVAPLFPS